MTASSKAATAWSGSCSGPRVDRHVTSLPYSDVFQIVAEVSITLAGFVGVVLVLRSNTSSRPMDANEMFHMLLSSLGVCGVALLPLISQPLCDSTNALWRVCTPVMGALHLVGASKGVNDIRKRQIGMPWYLMATFAPVSFVIVAASFAMGFGYWLEHAPGVYLFGLWWALLVAGTTFITLVFRTGGREPAPPEN